MRQQRTAAAEETQAAGTGARTGLLLLTFIEIDVSAIDLCAARRLER